jgi:anti-sigma B factor antagonist
MSGGSERSVLRIEGELSIYRAEELKQALLGEPSPTEIDLSGVTEIDTAGVQLLMLAKRSAQAAQRELRLVAHSPAVSDVFELLNLSAYFDDPLVMDARATGTAERPSTSSTARRTHES